MIVVCIYARIEVNLTFFAVILIQQEIHCCVSGSISLNAVSLCLWN